MKRVGIKCECRHRTGLCERDVCSRQTTVERAGADSLWSPCTISLQSRQGRLYYPQFDSDSGSGLVRHQELLLAFACLRRWEARCSPSATAEAAGPLWADMRVCDAVDDGRDEDVVEKRPKLCSGGCCRGFT